MSSPLSDVVSDQYERWMYPQPILDIQSWLVSNWQWFDPSHAHRLLWPDRDYKPAMDILVAGCGTNQAAIIAYTNPDARVMAIDVSQSSLDHHRYLKDRYGMNNLELHRMPIEEVESLDSEFDLVISTGVLHHLSDPDAGMAALGRCLKIDGVAAIMLYARYGRLGVEMMQGVFRDLDMRQTDASVLMVREALTQLPQDHPVKSYLSIAPDLRFDAGLVDTFLHGRERSYTVGDCLDLVSGAGLVFQEFFLKAPYHAAPTSAGALWHAIAQLPRERRWAVMERINFRNGCHFFTACRPERDPSRYRIDFDAPQSAAYVPALRFRCTLDGNRLSGPNWLMTLDPVQLAVVGLVDGRRNLADICEAVQRGSSQGGRSEACSLDVTRSVLRQIWERDLLTIAIA